MRKYFKRSKEMSKAEGSLYTWIIKKSNEMMISSKSVAIDSLKKGGISMNIVVFQIKRMNRFYKMILLNILIEGNSIF